MLLCLAGGNSCKWPSFNLKKAVGGAVKAAKSGDFDR